MINEQICHSNVTYVLPFIVLPQSACQCIERKDHEKTLGRIAQLAVSHFSKIILMRLFLKKNNKKIEMLLQGLST